MSSCVNQCKFEQEVIQLFCNDLAEGKVNSKLLRGMTEFSKITFNDFDNLVKVSFAESLKIQNESLINYKNKIILFVCAQNVGQGPSTTLPRDVVNLITLTAAIAHQKLLLDNSTITLEDKVDELLRPSSLCCGDLGVVSDIKYMMRSKKLGHIADSEKAIKKVNLFCDLLEGVIEKENYQASLLKIFLSKFE